jgi:hypothetical protein
MKKITKLEINKMKEILIETAKRSLKNDELEIELNEAYKDFVDEFFGKEFVKLFLHDLKETAFDLFSGNKREIDITTDIDDENIALKIELIKLNGKDLSERFLNTEHRMLEYFNIGLNNFEIENTFKMTSEIIFDGFKKAYEDYKTYIETVKSNPSKEDFIIHALVYIFNESSVDIEKEMLRRKSGV